MIDRITIRQLRSFVSVTHHKGFTLAAEAMSLTQPAVTNHIKQLEAHLRITLFDRKSRSTELTRQGLLFLQSVERLLRDFDVMVDDAKGLAEHRRGTARIACAGSLVSPLLVPAMRDMRAHHPEISVVSTEVDDPTVHDLVRSGQVEFAMIGSWVSAPDLAYQEIFQDRACVIYPRGHSLEKEKRITARHLASFPFIRSPAGTASGNFIVRALTESNVTVDTVCEVSLLMTCAAMVEQNIGVTILPALALASASTYKIAGKPLYKPALWRSCGFVTSRRRTLSPAAALLRSYLVKYLGNLPKLAPGAIKITYR
jgi:LysR family transcriptional regulator, carnitine catabolism transcriptional activator